MELKHSCLFFSSKLVKRCAIGDLLAQRAAHIDHIEANDLQVASEVVAQRTQCLWRRVKEHRPRSKRAIFNEPFTRQ